MVTQLEEIGLSIDARRAVAGSRDFTRATESTIRSSERATRQLRGLDGRFVSTGVSAEKAGRKVKGFGVSLTDLRSSLGGVSAVIATLTAVLGFRTINRAQEFENRLLAISASAEQAADRQARLVQVAAETRTGFAPTVELFSRLAFSAGELGISEEELFRVTKNLNIAVAASGASAESANAAIIQLSQGIASGTLRGEELNSVMEQLTVVADQIARSLGVSRGELREMGRQGRITADEVIKAFSQAGIAGELFGKTQETIADSTTAYTDAASRGIVVINDLLGISDKFQFTLRAQTNAYDTLTNAGRAWLETQKEINAVQEEAARFGGGVNQDALINSLLLGAPGSASAQVEQTLRDRYRAGLGARQAQEALRAAYGGVRQDEVNRLIGPGAAQGSAAAGQLARERQLGEERAGLQRYIDAGRGLFDAGRSLADGIGREINLATIFEEQAQESAQQERFRRIGNDIGFAIADPIGQAFLNQFRTVEEFFANFLANVSSATVQQFLTGPLANLFSQGLQGLLGGGQSQPTGQGFLAGLGGLGSALGGLFGGGGGASAEATSGGGGGFFSFLSGLFGGGGGEAANGAIGRGTPTRFFANGGVSGTSRSFGGVFPGLSFMRDFDGGLDIFGEGGKEAAMPLRELRDGKLGVGFEGPPPVSFRQTIVVQGVSNAREFRRSMRQNRFDDRRAIAQR